MSELPTRQVDKNKFRTYFDKATEFYSMIALAEQEQKWSAACLNAIHCTISCADALSTCFLGRRSTSQRHEDAAALIKQTRISGVEEKANQFVEIIRLKNLVEYQDDEPTENEARRLILQARRFYQWTKQQLGV